MATLLNLYEWLLARKNQEEGQGMVEYALILFLVSVVAIAILTTMGTNIVNVFTRIANALTGATGTGT